MIGKKVSSMCLDDAQLNFYQWDGELSDLLGKVLFAAFVCSWWARRHRTAPHSVETDAPSVARQVKDELNDVADTWTDDEKAHCLDETTKSFDVRTLPFAQHLPTASVLSR